MRHYSAVDNKRIVINAQAMFDLIIGYSQISKRLKRFGNRTKRIDLEMIPRIALGSRNRYEII